MKKTLIILAILFSAQFSYSQFSFGAGLTYDFLDDLGIKVLASADVTDEWRGQVSYSYFFSDWALDLDAQYKLVQFDMDYEEGYILPFVGLNIDHDDRINDTDLGINLGLHLNAGFENFRIFLEPKLTLGGTGGFILSIGTMF